MSDQESTFDDSIDSSSHEIDSQYSDESIPVVDIAEIIGDCGACDFNTAIIASRVAELENDLSKLETALQKLETARQQLGDQLTVTSDESPPPRTKKAAKNAKKNARRKLAKKLKKARGGTLEPIVTETSAIAPSALDTEMSREMSEKISGTEAQITDIEAQIADIEAQITVYKHREKTIVLKCKARRYYWFIHNVSHERQHLDGDELDSDHASPVDFLSYGKSLSLLRSQAVECEREIAALEQEKVDKKRGFSAATMQEHDTDGAEEPEVTDTMPKQETDGAGEPEVTDTMPKQETGSTEETGIVVSAINQGKSHFKLFVEAVMSSSDLTLGLLLVLVPVFAFLGFAMAVFHHICKTVFYAVFFQETTAVY